MPPHRLPWLEASWVLLPMPRTLKQQEYLGIVQCRKRLNFTFLGFLGIRSNNNANQRFPCYNTDPEFSLSELTTLRTKKRRNRMCNSTKSICRSKTRCTAITKEPRRGVGKRALPAAAGGVEIFIRAGKRMSGIRFTTELAIATVATRASSIHQIVKSCLKLSLLNCLRNLPSAVFRVSTLLLLLRKTSYSCRGDQK